MRRATVAAAPIDRPMATRVDDRHQRLGDADGGDRVGAEAADEEDVHHREHRLHEHLEHHRHREQHDGAADRRLGVVLVRAADGFAEGGPERWVYGVKAHVSWQPAVGSWQSTSLRAMG